MYEGRTTIEMISAVFESHRLRGPVSFPLKTRENPLGLLKPFLGELHLEGDDAGLLLHPGMNIQTARLVFERQPQFGGNRVHGVDHELDVLVESTPKSARRG